VTAERFTDAEFLARLDRDTEVSLRDHPERWRWVRAGGVKSSASADAVGSARPKPVGADLPPPPVSPRGNGSATRVRSEPPPEPHLTHDGLSLTPGEWAARTGLRRQAITLRLRAGWTVEETLTIPAGGRRPRPPRPPRSPRWQLQHDRDERIYAALAERGSRTRDQLVAELHLSSSLVRMALYRLRDAGRVAVIGSLDIQGYPNVWAAVEPPAVAS
jgi:hypothetical protein